MASITTFFGTQGGGGSVSGTATRVAFFGGTPGNPSTTLDDSANLEWDDTNSRLSVGDAATVGSTVTIAGAGATDSTSALEVRTSSSRADILLFRVYDNGRIESRTLDSSEAITDNIAIGFSAGANMTTAIGNTVVGQAAGSSITQGNLNTIIGSGAGQGVLLNSSNTLIGAGAGAFIATGDSNVAIGVNAIRNMAAGSNVAIGVNAGRYRGATGTTTNTSGSQSIYIGQDTRASTSPGTNEIVIGLGAVGNGSNSVTLGHTTVTNTYLRGDINLVEGGDLVVGTSTGTQIGTASSQKLAMWGKTPVVQPTTAGGSATVSSPGAGNTIKTDDTFDGYTLAQVVRALRNIGVLQ